MRPTLELNRTLHTFAVHLLLTCVATAVALMLAIGVSLFVPLVIELETVGVTEEMGRIANQLLELHMSYWPTLATTVFAVSLASFLLYRRMAGPMVRFTRSIQAIGEGVLPAPIRIRGSDYLGKEAAALNDMVAGLSRRIGDLQQAHARLDETLHMLVERSVERPGIEELVAEIQQLSKGMEDSLSRFRKEA